MATLYCPVLCLKLENEFPFSNVPVVGAERFKNPEPLELTSLSDPAPEPPAPTEPTVKSISCIVDPLTSRRRTPSPASPKEFAG